MNTFDSIKTLVNKGVSSVAKNLTIFIIDSLNKNPQLLKPSVLIMADGVLKDLGNLIQPTVRVIVEPQTDEKVEQEVEEVEEEEVENPYIVGSQIDGVIEQTKQRERKLTKPKKYTIDGDYIVCKDCGHKLSIYDKNGNRKNPERQYGSHFNSRLHTIRIEELIKNPGATEQFISDAVKKRMRSERKEMNRRTNEMIMNMNQMDDIQLKEE